MAAFFRQVLLFLDTDKYQQNSGRPKYSLLTDRNEINKATYLLILLCQVFHVHNIVRISNIFREIFCLQNTGTV